MEIIFRNTQYNFSPGREGKKPKFIVIHWFGSGTLESADARFRSKTGGASAHFGIDKKRIYQWVDVADTAWHAGNWPVNLESVGIEHFATPDHPLDEESKESSGQLLAKLSKDLGIPLNLDTVLPHKKFKATQCPGTISISELIDRSKKYYNSDLGGTIMQPNFKDEFLRIAREVYGDSYNESWNDAEKKVFVDKILEKSKDYKRRAEQPASPTNPTESQEYKDLQIKFNDLMSDNANMASGIHQFNEALKNLQSLD